MSARKLLLFPVAGRVFALEAAMVREILPAARPTRIPGAPPAVRGLVNVRGTMVAVLDVGLAVGARAEPSGGTLVLVEQPPRLMGLAVDEVLDLVAVDATALDDGSGLPGVRADLVRAVGSAGGQAFVQLATDALLAPLLP